MSWQALLLSGFVPEKGRKIKLASSAKFKIQLRLFCHYIFIYAYTKSFVLFCFKGSCTVNNSPGVPTRCTQASKGKKAGE